MKQIFESENVGRLEEGCEDQGGSEWIMCVWPDQRKRFN